MAQVDLPPPPRSQNSDRVFFAWLTRLHTRLTETNQILWTQIDKAGSALDDIVTRSHTMLSDISGVDETDTDTTLDKHVSNNLAKGWEDSKGTATTHIAASNAHGATGNVVGTGDTASTGTAGVVLQAATVADLNQTISATYTQSEVQDLSDKVDELLASLRTAGILDT